MKRWILITLLCCFAVIACAENIIRNGTKIIRIGTKIQVEASAPVGWSNTNSTLFDGVDEYVEVPDAPELRFGTNDFTISTWFKAPSEATHRTIISKGNDIGGGTGYQLYFRNNHALRFFYGAYAYLEDLTAYDDDVWHHVAVTRIGTTLKMYVDSIEVDSATPLVIRDFSSTDDLRIGRRYTSANYFDGNEDEVSLWDKGLSSNEVVEVYSGGSPADLANHSASTNIISWWRMGDDPDTPSLYEDRQGTNNGTGINSPTIEADVP